MDDDLKILESLHEEISESCNIHSYNSCRGCYIEELRKKYGLSDEDVFCSTLYIVIKLLGENQESIDYYMDNINKIIKTCKDEMTEDCHNCKYGKSFHTETEIPCYSYVIGMALLKEV